MSARICAIGIRMWVRGRARSFKPQGHSRHACVNTSANTHTSMQQPRRDYLPPLVEPIAYVCNLHYKL